MEDQNFLNDKENKNGSQKRKKLNPEDNKKPKYPRQYLSGLSEDLEEIWLNGINLNLEDLLSDEDFDDDYFDDEGLN